MGSGVVPLHSHMGERGFLYRLAPLIPTLVRGGVVLLKGLTRVGIWAYAGWPGVQLGLTSRQNPPLAPLC
jgi:hypothetical protein